MAGSCLPSTAGVHRQHYWWQLHAVGAGRTPGSPLGRRVLARCAARCAAVLRTEHTAAAPCPQPRRCTVTHTPSAGLVVRRHRVFSGAWPGHRRKVYCGRAGGRAGRGSTRCGRQVCACAEASPRRRKQRGGHPPPGLGVPLLRSLANPPTRLRVELHQCQQRLLRGKPEADALAGALAEGRVRARHHLGGPARRADGWRQRSGAAQHCAAS